METQDLPPTASPRALRRALSIGALSAVIVLLLRLALVTAIESELRGADHEFALWRLGEELGKLTGHAVLAGFTLALVALVARRTKAVALVGMLLGAAVVYTALAGWPWADPDQIPAMDTNRGLIGVACLGTAALVLSAVTVWLSRKPLQRDVLGSTFVMAFSMSALVSAPIAFSTTLGSREEFHVGKTEPVTRVLHEIAFEPSLWEAVSFPKGGKPRAHVITPSMDYRLDGGDMPALVMPPPSVVRFTVPKKEGQVWLNGRTGVDLSAPRLLPKQLAGARVRFSVEVDGAEVWKSVHEIQRDRNKPGGLLWKDLEGISLEPGQEVVLRSELLQPKDLERFPLIPMGFGSLVLEQRGEKRLMRATPESPNIVLIVMDTLRQDRLSSYGYELETTPALDSLAERGILYENAYSTASWTWPATASILTGLLPESHGVLADGECYLNNTVETLAELLSERNFITGAFTCNPLIVPNKNFDQGFDDFDSFHRFRHTALVIGGVRDWMRLNSDTRFFLYVQFTDTHEKYDLQPEALARAGGTRPEDYPRKGLDEYHGKLLRNEGHDDQGNSTIDEYLSPEYQEWMQHAYDAAVITADIFVGQLLTELEELGLEDKTIVAFTSDHGEEILDHGMLTHGHTLYPELTRVPLILAGPGLARGVRVETPVSNRHLAPSLAAIGNAFFKTEQDPVDLKNPDAIPAQPVFFSTKQGWWNGKFRLDLYGVRDGDWELHWAPKGRDWGVKEPAEGGQFRLYQLSEDPTTQVDVAADFPERASELLELLRNQIGRSIEGRPKLTVGAGKRSHEALVGIGYIQTEDEGADDEAEERE